MPISAKVICDSRAPSGIQLTTMLLRYPRFIHAEFMTHRVFSRNASSSRAIPVQRLIEDLRRDPAMPVYWGRHQAGMQAGEELDRRDIERCRMEWLAAMNNAIVSAEKMRSFGLHKQIANRILEPWVHINVVVTATDWANFWELRCHADAQPEIKALADAMHEAYTASTPRLLLQDQWHLPFVTETDYDQLGTAPDETLHTDPSGIGNAIKVSVARCARTSYLTHSGAIPELSADLALYDRLVGSRPLHASPAEHQARPDKLHPNGKWAEPSLHGNFNGWVQNRKVIEKELWTI